MVRLEKHIDSTHIHHLQYLHTTKNTTSYITTTSSTHTASTATNTQTEAEINYSLLLFPPLEVLIQAVVESLLLLSCPLYKAVGESAGGVYMCSLDRCDEEASTVCVLLSSFFDIHSKDVCSGDNTSVEMREIATTGTASDEALNDQRSRTNKVTRNSNKRVRVDEDPSTSKDNSANTTIPTIFSSYLPSSQAHTTTTAKRLKSHTPSPSPSSHTAITHTHSSHWSCPCCTLLNIMQYLSCHACGSIRPSPLPPPPTLSITPTGATTTASTAQSMTSSPSTMTVPHLPYPTPSGSGVHHSHPHQHTVIDLIATDDSDDDDDDGTHEGEGDIHIHMKRRISEEHTPTVTPTIINTTTTIPYKGHDLIDLCDDDEANNEGNGTVTDSIPYIHQLPHPLILNTIGHNSDPSYITDGERDMYDDDYILLGLVPYEDYSGTIRMPLKRYDELTLCYIRTMNKMLPSRTNHTHSHTPTTTTATNMTVVSTHASDSYNTNSTDSSSNINNTINSNNNGDMQRTSSSLVFEPITAEIYGRRYNSNSNSKGTKSNNKSTGKSKFWGKYIHIHINIFVIYTLLFYALTYIDTFYH